jgi:hypothetical protein
MPLFLSQVNKLLVTVNELPVADFEGYVAQKAVNAFQGALTFVSSLYRWPHLKTEVAATSWVGDTIAVLPEFQSVINVYDGTTRAQQIEYSQLKRDYGTLPVWCYRDQQSLLFQPQSAAQKAALRFHLLLMPTIPQTINDNVTLDAPFLRCVMLYAENELHRTHTTDLAAGNAASRQFEVELQTLRTRRESDTPTHWRF